MFYWHIHLHILTLGLFYFYFPVSGCAQVFVNHSWKFFLLLYTFTHFDKMDYFIFFFPVSVCAHVFVIRTKTFLLTYKHVHLFYLGTVLFFLSGFRLCACVCQSLIRTFYWHRFIYFDPGTVLFLLSGFGLCACVVTHEIFFITVYTYTFWTRYCLIFTFRFPSVRMRMSLTPKTVRLTVSVRISL